MKDQGAHFYRTDFQVHSPRDPNWRGERPRTETERQLYSNEFVARCRQVGLHAIAITDHHDLGFYPYVKEAAENELTEDGGPLPEEDRLVVFPGMELTVSVPCQALVVFDAGVSLEELRAVPPALGIVVSDPSEPTHLPTERLTHISSLDDIYNRLDEHPFLKGRFIVLPHVGNRGNFSLLRTGFAPRYVSMPCVGGFVDGELSALNEGNRRIVEGKDPAWGYKKLGVFQTSDSRSRDFTQLGRASTWVKWAKPTAEAIRQACLASESRIAQEQPAYPSSRIEFVRVSNSKFLGPVDLALNPQYCAVIGGRGTGKSSLLEYIRWALCDQPASDLDDDDPVLKRRHDLVAATLAQIGATVDVGYSKNGVRHVVRRKSHPQELLLKIDAEEYRQVSEEEVRSLLPIQAYSQKQLSGVGARQSELKRMLEGPSRDELRRLNQQLESARAAMRGLFSSFQEHRRAKAEVGRLAVELSSLSRQIERLRKSMKDVSPSDLQVIERQSKYDDERRLLEDWTSRLSAMQGELRTRAAALSEQAFPEPDDGPNAALFHDLAGVLEKIFADASRLLSDAADDNTAAQSEVRRLTEAWRNNWREQQREYERASERYEQYRDLLRKVEELEERKAELEQQKKEASSRVSDSENSAEAFFEKRSLLGELAVRIGNVLQQQSRLLTSQSKGRLRVQVERFVTFDEIAEKLRTAFKGSKVRGTRTDELVDSLSSCESRLSAWTELQDELLHILHKDPSDSFETPRLHTVGFSSKELEAIGRSMSAGEWLELAVLLPADRVLSEYSPREGEFIRFSDASAGQQATTLLFILLNQDGPPLIIDQPEDDLDNKVIPEIVEEVWSAKGRRQLVFSSHNANLVVNGDAELVAVFDHRVANDHSGGQIEAQGAIDLPDVRSRITSVMEGGKAAFELRKAKYGF
ncbi:MAG: TrlF family AAA-like ATPase [Myxococcota bacterium]